jgi:hypothetical protein
LVRADEVIE